MDAAWSPFQGNQQPASTFGSLMQPAAELFLSTRNAEREDVPLWSTDGRIYSDNPNRMSHLDVAPQGDRFLML